VTFIGLEIIQRRVLPISEALVAPLAFPILDVFVNASLSISNQGMDALISDPEIVTF